MKVFFEKTYQTTGTQTVIQEQFHKAWLATMEYANIAPIKMTTSTKGWVNFSGEMPTEPANELIEKLNKIFL